MTASSESVCKPRKLGKRLQALVDRLGRGEKLCKSLRLKEAGETEIEFHFEPSGKRAPLKTSQEAIGSGLVTPAGDGLLGSDTSQTWVLS